ncbi:hypothetical protein B4923_10095 [Brenneria roseae subsp. americana]|uniref:Uncharacterized protein n=1 Tax=Brenneria roseae subsp. americana TaxID=1508507 RepID=A0A2U1TU40_9GAMM|nr:hypothetical protein [Brenneria roseae]PWC12862.1 hypothetical protein B4923_10095 [Brenneria roseae subsp. americana]
MDSTRPHRTFDIEFSRETENVTELSTDLNADAVMATFEAIEFSDENTGCIENEAGRDQRNPLPVLTEEEINAKNEKIKQIKDTSLSASLDDVSELAISFFILAIEGTKAPVTELANAIHDAFSSSLNDEKTGMIEAFDIAMKKEMLTFIKVRFIIEAYQSQAAEIIDNYISELVSRRDSIRLGAANAEFLLASGLGDEKYADAVQSDIEALKQGTYPSQVEMSRVLSIAGSACSVVDMLDQFEMMLRNSGRSAPTLDTELQHLGLLADHWDDFVQKYAPRTLKKR